MHKHLFSCLLVYAILSSLLKMNLLLRRSYSPGASAVSGSGDDGDGDKLDLYCLMLSLCLRFFRSSTYLCMFNEAFYLYQLIRKAFTAPSITPLLIIAYAVPALMTSSYIAARALIPSDPWTGATATAAGSGSILTSSSSGIATSAASADPLISTTGAELTAASQDDDPCWMLPARDAWKEWIINGPNLCMLLVRTVILPSSCA